MSDQPRSGAQQISWLELFYDLVFVATIVTFSDAVTEHPKGDVIAVVIPAFAAVWWIWLVTTLLANRFRTDDSLQRGLVLVQMLLLLLIALHVGDGLEQHESFVSVAYALLCVDVAVMHARHASVPGSMGETSRARRNEFAIAAVLFVVAGGVGGAARYALWGVGMIVIVVPSVASVWGRRRGLRDDEAPVDEHHLSERLGLLTIVVCGEAFVKVALISAESRVDSLDVLVMGAMFVLVFAMWWSYFDDFPNAGVARTPVRFQLWFLAHFCFQVSVIGIAVGYGELVPLHLGSAMTEERTLLTVLPIIGAFSSLALLGVCTRRRPLGPLLAVRLTTALAIGVAGAVVEATSWIDVEPAAITFAVIALAQAVVADRVRRHTAVLTG